MACIWLKQVNDRTVLKYGRKLYFICISNKEIY